MWHDRKPVTATREDLARAGDYFRAMEEIEGEQTAVLEPQPVPETAFALLDKLGQEELSDEQRQILDDLRRCLTPE